MMYNQGYHPLIGENLEYICYGETQEVQNEIKRQADLANLAGLRKFRITITDPDDQGRGGHWFDIQNGQCVGSCRPAK